MKNTICLGLFSAAAVTTPTAIAKENNKTADENRPNILLICPEDNGIIYGCYGSDVSTPNVDALARSGIRFENAFCGQAGSSPGRACFLTGLHPHQNGQVGLSSWSYSLYSEDTPNMINSLKENGYHTGMVGKLHVNPESAFTIDYHKLNNGNFLRENMEKYAEYSREFIENCGNEPFYLQVNYPDTHLPFIAQVDGQPEKLLTADDVHAFSFLGLDTPETRRHTANYLNCLSRLDHYVGELLKMLEESGKAGNTMIIYVADHGIDMVRSKHTAYDTGFRIPMIISWPGHFDENKTYEGIVSQLDIYPTVLSSLGLEVPSYLPGKSLTEVLEGSGRKVRKYIVNEYNSHANTCPYPMRSVRTRRFQLIWNPLHGTENPNFKVHLAKLSAAEAWVDSIATASSIIKETYLNAQFPPEFELYDLKKDPEEFVNKAYNFGYRHIRKRLYRKLVRWQKETKDAFIDTSLARRFYNEVMNQGKDRSVFPYKDYMDPHVDFDKK